MTKVKLKFKAMLIFFFYINSIVMTEWVPEYQTVNQTYYLQSLGNTARASLLELARVVETPVMDLVPGLPIPGCL